MARASMSDLAMASLLMVTVRPVGLPRSPEAGPSASDLDTERGRVRRRRPALRLVQRTKEARRCQENRRLGRGLEEAGPRLVWRLQEPWARLRLERQRELRTREAGDRPSRRQRLTPRLQRTVTT